ncbi:MAG TPA: hypothetical protein VEY12_09925 [Thermoplasmata archaeon]|nr:hypothetical protein [Thermoplasmata archaeon]
MSRRLPGPTFAAVLCLLAIALGAPLLATPGRAYGEQVFQANPIVGAGDPSYGVYANITLAQSFLVNQDYLLTNVTLRVRNDGGPTNPLVVSIHPDDPSRHVPAMSTLLASTSQVSPNNASTPVNWSFPFNPSPILWAKTVYWIVAENTATKAPPKDGYEWHDSGADTYANGTPYLYNTTSKVWTGLPFDLYFITFGRKWESNVSLAMTASPPQPAPGDTATFTVDFNNTGSQAARRVWINMSLPTGLENVSAAFPDIQPVPPTALPNLLFQSVSNGAHAFTIAGQVAIGTPPGSLVTVGASLASENATGTVFRNAVASASVLVGLVTKQLYLGSTSVATKLLTTGSPTNPIPASSTLNPGAPQPIQFLQSPPLAKPFVAMTVAANLWVSTQKVPPQTYRLNVSLLDNGTPVVSQHPTFTLSTTGYQQMSLTLGNVNYTFGRGHVIGLSLWSNGGGTGSSDNLLLRYNGTGYPSHLDLVTTTYVSIDGLSLTDPVAPGGPVWSTLDPIVVRANVSDPFGRGKIAGVWINITSPAGTNVAAGAMNLLTSDPSPLPAWAVFNSTLSPPLLIGRYRIDVAAIEDNGVASRARGFAEVAMPNMGFVDIASAGRPQAGGAFAYFLEYNNTGTGTAGRVWINETLPTGLAFSGSSVPASWSAGNRYGWNLTNVSVGSHELEIDVNVPGSVIIQEWIQDNATLAYTDTSGHVAGRLSAYAAVFVNGPILVVSLSSAPATVIHANETAVYTVAFQNLGRDSGTIWVNDTLPTGFGYVTDTAGNLSGTMIRSGSVLAYRFPGIQQSREESFQITVAAGPSLGRNQSYLNRVDIAYTSANGYLMPRNSTSLSLLAAAPWFSQAGVSFLSPRSTPGGFAATIVNLENAGNEPASWAWLNLTFDLRLTIVDASRPFTVGLGTAHFALQDVGTGRTVVFLNLTVNPTVADGVELPIGGTLEARDGLGNPLPFATLARDFLFVGAASFRLSAAPLQPTIEAGTVLPLSIATSNVGSSTAANAWLNVTLPGVLEYLGDTADVNVSAVGLSYSWHWTGASHTLAAGGLDAFTLSLGARGGTPNGTYANITLRLEYQDADLVSRPGITITVRAVVVAPMLVLTIESSATGVVSGGTFNYTIQVANRGLSAAHRVWLQDQLDPNLRLISYASSVPANGNSTLNWTFADLAPGTAETIQLTVRTVDGLAPQTFITNSLEATYTNSQGAGLGSIRALPVTVRIVQDLTPFLWILGAAAVCGTAIVFLLTRRSHVEIEDVFLVYRDGVLISHLSRTLLREKDEDVLSGMLTAVQEFVRDAFQYGEHRELHQLDFGDYRILIERGKYVYLAVVYSGEQSNAIRKKVRSVIDLIEAQFGPVLEKWDGDMDEVVGARELIREALLGSTNHNHTQPSIPQYE